MEDLMCDLLNCVAVIVLQIK